MGGEAVFVLIFVAVVEVLRRKGRRTAERIVLFPGRLEFQVRGIVTLRSKCVVEGVRAREDYRICRRSD